MSVPAFLNSPVWRSNSKIPKRTLESAGARLPIINPNDFYVIVLPYFRPIKAQAIELLAHIYSSNPRAFSRMDAFPKLAQNLPLVH